jgi:hypothetical protein
VLEPGEIQTEEIYIMADPVNGGASVAADDLVTPEVEQAFAQVIFSQVMNMQAHMKEELMQDE